MPSGGGGAERRPLRESSGENLPLVRRLIVPGAPHAENEEPADVHLIVDMSLTDTILQLIGFKGANGSKRF